MRRRRRQRAPVDKELHEAVPHVGDPRGLGRDPDGLEDGVELLLGEEVRDHPGGEQVIHVDEEPLVHDLGRPAGGVTTRQNGRE